MRLRALDIARGELGVRECGHNAGARVELYQQAVRLPTGSSWCAAFVVWCYQQAAADLEEPCLVPATGSVHRLWTRSAWAQWEDGPPPVGAVFCHDSGGGHGHCGFVEEVRPGEIVTVEGNTNDDGSRDGDGVYRRVRPLSYANLGYLVYDDHASV